MTTGPGLYVVTVAFERDEGLCQRCGSPQSWEHRAEVWGWSLQHRKARGNGGDNRLSNLCVLCGTGTTGCHGWVEAHKTLAVEDGGWAIYSWVPNELICQQEILTPKGWALLDDEGGRTLVSHVGGSE